MPSFVRETHLPTSADDAFAWHERPGAFERLLPPWDTVHVHSMRGGIQPGARAEIDVRLAPLLWKRWVAEHRDYQPGRLFRDVQISGPFASWDHRHIFEPAGPSTCLLRDQIDYQLPMGVIGKALGSTLARRKLARIFAYRHAVTREDLAHHARLADRPRMRVLVSGSSGVIGRTTCALLSTGGHTVARLVRPPRVPSAPGDSEILWDPSRATVDAAAIERFAPDAVLHLAGESIAGRWTAHRMHRLRTSRIASTDLLARTLAALPHPPTVFLCASGTSIYGNRADEPLDESGTPGSGFLASLAQEWEAAAIPAARAGMRIVHLRIGWVLTPRGGALAQMLPFFNLGLGGRVGSGRQFISWISIDDCAAAIDHALLTPTLRGPVNLVAPNPVRNVEFTRTLGHLLRRPTIAHCPAWLARRVFGQLADESVLSGQRVRPRVLDESGFVFRHTDLRAALAHVLGRAE